MADADGWNGPGSADSNGIRLLLAKIARIEQQLAEVQRGAPLRAAGIGVDEDGMTVDRSLAVTGDLDVTGDAEFSGDTTIGGNLTVSGTFSLPDQSIQDDWLASPLTHDSDFGNSDTFAIGTVEASSPEFALFTVTVPAGYTKAFFTMEGAAGVRNLGASATFAYLRCYADYPSGFLTWGSRQNVRIEPGTTGTAAALLVRSVEESLVGGQVLRFFVTVYADDAQAAHATNFASAAALVTFTR